METLRHPSSELQARQNFPLQSAVQSKVDAPTLDLEDLYCILQIQSDDNLIALELVRQLRARGNIEEALKVMRSCLKIDYRFETLHLLGQLEYQADLIDDAFAHLSEALPLVIESTDELFELFKTLGNVHARRGDFDSAEECYNKAHRIRPHSDILHVNVATLYVQRSKWDEALFNYRRAIELNPANDRAWVGLALVHRQHGDAELAWGNLEAALEYNALNEVALGLLLEWSVQSGREFRALEFVRNFLVEGGWNEKMSLAFAWLSWRRGDVMIARLELERLLAVNPLNEQALQMVQEMRACP